MFFLPSADIISTVEFNHDGEFLATGDKGGRVVVFQRDGTRVSLVLFSYSGGFGSLATHALANFQHLQ